MHAKKKIRRKIFCDRLSSNKERCLKRKIGERVSVKKIEIEKRKRER